MKNTYLKYFYVCPRCETGFIFIYNVLNKIYEIINTIYKRIITFRTY